jgi:hypothetical protein
MSGWRSCAPLELLVSVKPAPAPPDEPDGPCMHAGCPRTGTAVAGDLVACGFHRGAESTRAGTRIIGQRAGDSQ